MPGTQTCVFKTVDACRIRADVHRPDGGGTRAVIVWIHGGCLINGSRRGIRPAHLRAYLDAGYAVVAIDYRLAPETKLPAIIEDLIDAFAWTRGEAAERFDLDAERIAVVGHSAGGYLTLMSGSCVTPRPRALVSFYGYGDIIGAWYAKPDDFYCSRPAVAKDDAYALVGREVISETTAQTHRGPYYVYLRQHGLWPKEVGGVDPEADPDAFTPWCPVRNVTGDYPPTLLLHGTDDTDVPYDQSVAMAEALAQAGVVHAFFTATGGGHGFDADDPSAPQRVVDFLAEHIS